MHLISHEGVTYSPEGIVDIPVELAAEYNATQDRMELEYWATGPETFAPAYVRPDGEVRTWLGSRLGTVSQTTYGPWRHAQGWRTRTLSYKVKGSNGLWYYARTTESPLSGGLIRLRRYKGQR